MARTKEKIVPVDAVKIVFTKNKVLAANRYGNRVDLLRVLLEDGKTYTFTEVDELITKFMKGRG